MERQIDQSVRCPPMNWQIPLRLLLAGLCLVTLSGLQAQPGIGQDPEAMPGRYYQGLGKALLASPERRAGVFMAVDVEVLQQAEQFFGTNQAPRAVALLAEVLRKDPSNPLAAERLLAALNQRNFPRLLDVSNAPAQPTFDGKLPCRSPDGGRELRRQEDRSGRLYDARTGQPVGAPMVHAKGITAAWFSPDGLRVATTSNPDGSARIWDATTGMPLSSLLG